MRVYNKTELESFVSFNSNGKVANRFKIDMRYTYIIGSAAEIKAVYRSMVKAFNKNVSNIMPTFSQFPKFHNNKFYGIIIEHQGREPYDTGINDNKSFQVLGEHTIIDCLLF